MGAVNGSVLVWDRLLTFYPLEIAQQGCAEYDSEND